MKTRKKYIVVLTVLFLTLANVSCSDPGEWTDYLGNSQRTGYSTGSGPDMPEVLWKVSTPGAFDTSPFIVGGEVLVLWKNDMYHLSKTKVILLDLMTGDILEEVIPPVPEEYHIFEVFPVDNRIIGLSFRGIYEIDVASGKTVLLTKIPEKSSNLQETQQTDSEDRTGRPFYYTSNRYPLILEDKIVFPTSPAVCFSKSDFSTVWNLEEVAPNLSLDTYSVVGDRDIVFFLAKNGVSQLIAVDLQSGALKWVSDPLPLALWLALGDDTVYCGGRSLWAFKRDGSSLWEFSPAEDIVSNVVVGPNGIYCADAAHNLYKIDPNGNLIWKVEWQGSPCFQSHLIGAGDILYSIENLGDSAIEPSGSQVTAYSMEDGSKLWCLYFGDSSWTRAPPALANGILVVGRVGGTITAVASDPELYMLQGDAYLSKGNTEKAINSYEKAAELYEKKGDTSRSQEILNRIQDLENQPGSSTPSSPEPTALPESPPPRQSSWILISAGVISAGILAGILIAYYLFKRKKS